MSIETQVAELVANTTKLTERIEGDEWDGKVQESKNEMTEFMSASKAEMTANFKNNSIKKIFVMGDKEKFYPVLIPVKEKTKINKISIHRGYYHEDANVLDINGIANPRNNTGNCHIEFDIFLDHWVNNGNVLSLTKNHYEMNTFLADYKASDLSIYGLVVWLRGNHSYYISNDMIDMKTREFGELNLATELSFDSQENMETATDVPSNENGGSNQRCKDGSIAIRLYLYSKLHFDRNFEVLEAVDAIIPNQSHYYRGV